VKPEALESALLKYEKMRTDMTGKEEGINEGQLQQLMSMMAGRSYKNRFLSRLGDQIKSISLDEIAYFRADDNIVFLVSPDGHKHIVEHKLEELEDLLDPLRFFRLNRTYIAEISSVRKVSKYFNSRLAVKLEPGQDEQVLVSRAKAKDFMAWLDQ